jgi:hypothetical protein
LEVVAHTLRRRAGWGVWLDGPSWVPAVALSAALTGVLLAWDPRVPDLAAHTFRSELFARHGFAIFNGSWYGGHYVLTQSALFPPLAALIGARLVAAAAVVWSVYLFDRLARTRWGDGAGMATLWYGAGAVTMLASGRLSFALGVALALASLRALQVGRPWLGATGALGSALASPVAAVFLAGIIVVASLVERPRSLRSALGVSAAALLPVAVLNTVFAEQSQEPFSFSAWVALPLWCAAALYLSRGLTRERALRAVVAGYLLVGTLVWLVPNPLGGNVTRLGALFGGPVLAAVVPPRRLPLQRAILALAIAGSLWWQLQPAVRDVAEGTSDQAAHASYYRPLANWLHSHGGQRSRLEVPFTSGHWESAYLAPDFQLARGWLRQEDRARNVLFYRGKLTHAGYREWLRENAVRYVALPDAGVDYSARAERRLIVDGPSYLRLRAQLPHWRVYEVVRARPLVEPVGPAAGRLREIGPDSFVLTVRRPGTFVVRIRETPFWSLKSGVGCVGDGGPWTVVRADRPGTVKVSIAFSPRRAWRAATGGHRRC